MLVLLLLLSLWSPQAASAPASWPQFRNTPALTGVAASSIPATLKVLWTYDAGGAVESSAASGGGMV